MSKDTATKNYFSDNERFADIFNYLIFNGRRIISPENLVEQDTTELLAYMLADGEILSEQKYRDLLKRCIIKYKGEEAYVLMGIENQADVHYAMPLRNNIYDVINYAKQVEKITKRHRKEGDLRGAEFLSGFSKDDKIIPVVTLVVYWSPDEWEGPKSLYDIFEYEHEEVLNFVNDYKINIIEPGKIENTKDFATDLRYVMDFIKVSKDKNGMKRLLEEEREAFSRIATDAAVVINECANVKLSIDEAEEETNMCKAWEDMAQEVREETKRETEARMCAAWEDMAQEVREETKRETEARMCAAWEDMAQEVREETEARMCKAWEDRAQEVREETEKDIIYKLYSKGKLSLEEAIEETGLSKEEFLTKLK